MVASDAFEAEGQTWGAGGPERPATILMDPGDSEVANNGPDRAVWGKIDPTATRRLAHHGDEIRSGREHEGIVHTIACGDHVEPEPGSVALADPPDRNVRSVIAFGGERGTGPPRELDISDKRRRRPEAHAETEAVAETDRRLLGTGVTHGENDEDQENTKYSLHGAVRVRDRCQRLICATLRSLRVRIVTICYGHVARITACVIAYASAQAENIMTKRDLLQLRVDPVRQKTMKRYLIL